MKSSKKNKKINNKPKNSKKTISVKRINEVKKKNNDVLYFIVVLAISTLLSMILHMGLLHTNLFNNMNVLFYRGIALIFVDMIILFIVLKLLSDRFLKIDIKDIICIILVSFSINITFFTLVPVTIERSVTCFTLGKFDTSENKTLNKSDIEKVFIDSYVYENGAFDKRFEEQVTTGSIEKIENDEYRLTKRGENLINMFHFIAKLYNVSLKNMSR